ncbi:hypothetical protein REPUB_Repub07fG0167300 [Reevesia pubescens]
MQTLVSDIGQGVRTTDDMVTHSTWHPPPAGTIKINIDVAFYNHSMVAKLGVVARDYAGRILFSAAMTKTHIASAFLGELHAKLMGLDLSKDWGFDHIILESDCLLAVTEVLRLEPSMMLGRCLVGDIREARASFISSSILFTYRHANKLAHNVATLAEFSNTVKTWYVGLPPSMSDFVME